jgi:hypothetical protein
MMRYRRLHLPENCVDHLLHVNEYIGTVATGMTEHFDGGSKLRIALDKPHGNGA